MSSGTIDEMWIHDLTVGYDLDGGGYTFEMAPEPLKALGAYVWNDPKSDYIPWVVGYDSPAAMREFKTLGEAHWLVYAMRPDAPADWPGEFVVDGSVYVLVRHGILNETEHECFCTNDPGGPIKDCTRCNGTGTVCSFGGAWALYAVLAPEEAPLYRVDAEDDVVGTVRVVLDKDTRAAVQKAREVLDDDRILHVEVMANIETRLTGNKEWDSGSDCWTTVCVRLGSDWYAIRTEDLGRGIDDGWVTRYTTDALDGSGPLWFSLLGKED